MPIPKAARLFLAAMLFLSLGKGVGSALALEDGFGPARQAEGKYFTVYYSPEIEAFSLLRELRISASDQVLAGGTLSRGDSAGAELTDMVDILFNRVCSILDMQVYSYKGNIKVCRSHQQLEGIYTNLFGRGLGGQKSFYVYDLNTIYISAESFTREILGHEMAHAIICHYFVVAPSVKVQEILSSYVEYQLRKFNE